MTFLRITSPHTTRAGTAGSVMQTVIIACTPGLVALTLSFGIGSIINTLLTALFCLAFEAVCLKLRGRPLAFYLKDYSALVTAVLLGLALPPYAPWWIVAVGSFFAIVVAKQMYGGLGFNPFNPAMVGYVVLLISFPVEMTRWTLDIAALPEGIKHPDLLQALTLVFVGADSVLVDGYTAATPLDVLKQNNSLTLDTLYSTEPVFSSARWAGAGWEWVNLAFLAGGVYLLYKKVFTWHAPVAMLLAITLMAALFYDGGSSTSTGSPLFHLLSGATMFGAFFIITDPVSSAVSTRGRLIYGACIGILVFVIRAWGNYPDAIAFAVLLMNFAAPFIDYYTLPRTYGHEKSRSGRVK